ncbi:MAG: ABC transporter ATP-binding protein, partial [Azorhizobium sp. 32-67-21]
MLEVINLNAWYGRSHILQGVGFEVGQGEAVCLIGRNGAGKTTTLRSIMGLVGKRTGSVMFKGQEIISSPTHKRLGMGLA